MKIFCYILLMFLAYFAGMIATIMAALDLAMATTMWNHPPDGWYIRLFAWDTLLICNVLSTFAVSIALLFWVLFIVPKDNTSWRS